MKTRISVMAQHFRLVGVAGATGGACGVGVGSLAGDMTLLLGWTVLCAALGVTIGLAAKLLAPAQ